MCYHRAKTTKNETEITQRNECSHYFNSFSWMFSKIFAFSGIFCYIKQRIERTTMNPYLDIYQFTHFRKFLEEYQAARANAEPHFTRTEICNLLGLEKSRSYFADVLR